ncbi:MAG: type II toxin-antitoxin system prevent-host-death family antitoxin [Phascolarctobacterium sp.]|nr:type II toxin-antitoxin system prevent-host-death family antitoxin [Phascolarctobacterium sp.]
MIQIKPVSDLRNKFLEIEKLVNEGNPVYLTKNGYGAMVVLSIEAYSNLIDGVEEALDLADAAAAENDARLSHDEVFGKLRAMVNG